MQGEFVSGLYVGISFFEVLFRSLLDFFCFGVII